MKLFQNLSTDLAEEVVKSLFLFIALAAILFNIAEIHSLVQEKSFKGFSIFSSGAILFNAAERFE